MKNLPKGKLLALLAVFAAIGLVTATGAFTSVQATRTVDVNVAGDASALVGLAPNSSGHPNAAYATESTEGDLVIRLDADNPTSNSGQGVNVNATTYIDYIFDLTNQGTQSVTLSVTYTVNSPSTGLSAPSDFYLYTYESGSRTTLNSGSTLTLGEGNHDGIGLYIDSTGLTQSDTIDVTITINADA